VTTEQSRLPTSSEFGELQGMECGAGQRLPHADILNIAGVKRRLIADWSGLQQHVIDEVIDPVAWTAARLCESSWATALIL